MANREAIKAKIRGSKDLRVQPLIEPQWSISEEDKLFLREVRAEDRQRLDATLDDDKLTDMQKMAVVLRLGVVNEDGDFFFEDGDIEWLEKKAPHVLQRQFDALSALLQVREEDVKKKQGES